MLPGYGIDLVEVRARDATATAFISATTVRAALAAGDLAAVERLVPPATLAFLAVARGRRAHRCERLGRRKPRIVRPQAESRKPEA